MKATWNRNLTKLNQSVTKMGSKVNQTETELNVNGAKIEPKYNQN